LCDINIFIVTKGHLAARQLLCAFNCCKLCWPRYFYLGPSNWWGSWYVVVCGSNITTKYEDSTTYLFISYEAFHAWATYGLVTLMFDILNLKRYCELNFLQTVPN